MKNKHPLTFAATSSSINLPEGRMLNVNVKHVNVKQGENDPAKKTPVEPKRPYNKIVNWQEGCPDCGSILQSYASYRQHVSYRCKSRPN